MLLLVRGSVFEHGLADLKLRLVAHKLRLGSLPYILRLHDQLHQILLIVDILLLDTSVCLPLLVRLRILLVLFRRHLLHFNLELNIQLFLKVRVGYHALFF